MHIGIPKEIKNHEYRVALTPEGAHGFNAGGCRDQSGSHRQNHTPTTHSKLLFLLDGLAHCWVTNMPDTK